MFNHTQTIRWLLPTNLSSVFDHFVGLPLKGLINKLNKVHSDTFKQVASKTFFGAVFWCVKNLLMSIHVKHKEQKQKAKPKKQKRSPGLLLQTCSIV